MVVLANEPRSPCPCSILIGSDGSPCPQRDTMLDLSRIRADGLGLGSYVKSLIHSLPGPVKGTLSTLIPVANVRTFPQKGEMPSPQQIRRSAATALSLAPGGIALFCGIHGSNIFDALFPGVPFVVPANPLLAEVAHSGSSDVVDACQRDIGMYWRSNYKAVYFHGRLYIAMRQHFAYASQATEDLLQNMRLIGDQFLTTETNNITKGVFRTWVLGHAEVVSNDDVVIISDDESCEKSLQPGRFS